MDTYTIGTDETGQYGAGRDKFAIEDTQEPRRAVITVTAEAENEEAVVALMENIKDNMRFANYKIVDDDELNIPESWEGLE